MTSLPPNPRYEKKLWADGLTLAEVLAGVQRHPSVFRQVYPPRTVNNIYLDTPARRDYHDHVNGIACRSKTRVRWYGEELLAVEHPRLERKLKRGMVSGKEAYALSGFSIKEGSLRASLRTAFDTAGLPPRLRQTLQSLEPAVFNRYQRHYFLSGDGKFRLTVDSELQFAGVKVDRRATVVSTRHLPPVVIELKYGPEFAEIAEFVTNAFVFRVARFSKYVVGMEHM